QLRSLLCTSRERPCSGRAAEQRDELAALHSITSSARARNASGIVSSIALAVLRLTTSSNFVGCSTGRSAGFAPRKNLVNELCSSAEQVGDVCSIGYQTACFGILSNAVHRRQPRAQCQGVDVNPVAARERVSDDIKRLHAAPKRLEAGRDILGSPDFR